MDLLAIFVAGAAVADSQQQERAIVNTILSLSVSTVCTFWLSSILSKNGRFRPVDIQNATLAGGVAIGCTANLSMSAFAAVMIGATAGLTSAFGFNVLQPILEENMVCMIPVECIICMLCHQLLVELPVLLSQGTRVPWVYVMTQTCMG